MPRRFFGTQHPFADADPEALYQTLGGFLQRLLVRRFAVPQEDAELLVREAFLVYYQLKVPVSKEREWLIGAACRRANTWIQTRGLPPGNDAAIARNFGKTLAHRDGCEMLNEQAQEALRLRFAEKKTYEEIAADLGVSTFRAQRIVTKALADLRKLLRGGGTPQP